MVVRIVGVEGNRVTLETPYTELFNQPEMEITIGTPKKKRSLDANAYFHVLVGQIADKMNISKPMCKNIMLSRYGQYEIHDGKQVMISVLSEIDMMNREDIHCSPVAYRELNGKQFTHYAIMKPSHEMTNKEFHKLLEGTKEEAKALGIETVPETVIERMIESWKNTTRS